MHTRSIMSRKVRKQRDSHSNLENMYDWAKANTSLEEVERKGLQSTKVGLLASSPLLK